MGSLLKEFETELSGRDVPPGGDFSSLLSDLESELERRKSLEATPSSVAGAVGQGFNRGLADLYALPRKGASAALSGIAGVDVPVGASPVEQWFRDNFVGEPRNRAERIAQLTGKTIED